MTRIDFPCFILAALAVSVGAASVSSAQLIGKSQKKANQPNARANQQNAPAIRSTTEQKQNINISVSDDDRRESLKIKWNQGIADVTYASEVDGAKDIKNYRLKNLDDLAKQNARAFELYRQHAGQNNANGERNRFDGILLPRNRSRSPSESPGYRRPSGNMQSSSSSAWQTAGMTNNNGRIRRFNRSGTTGNGRVGGQQMTPQMAAQIRQMIQQTDDPRLKRALQEMLKK